MIINYNEHLFEIGELENAYVSPYSMFMIENYPLNLLSSKVVCDFGAGTGVLGLIASTLGKMKIISIENDTDCYKLLIHNYKLNGVFSSSTLFFKSVDCCIDKFDTIICNPASLPSFINANSFCDGGELGIDMILEVINFASKNLQENGKLYIIITSILPRSIVADYIRLNGLEYRIISKKMITFREHYSGITTWVDTLKSTYEEMYYLNNGEQMFEELFLWEVNRRKHE